jgi:hypothetical protein
VGVLEREKAELDDRVGALETSLAATDKLAAQDFATKVTRREGILCCPLKRGMPLQISIVKSASLEGHDHVADVRTTAPLTRCSQVAGLGVSQVPSNSTNTLRSAALTELPHKAAVAAPCGPPRLCTTKNTP